MFPLGPLPHIQHHNAGRGLPPTGKYLRLYLFQRHRFTKTKKYGRTDQMKEQIKTPEKELSNEGIANLSDAQFKTLVIRMFTEMTECRCKTEEEVRAMQSDMKENVQGANSDGKETRTQVNNLEQTEEIKIQLGQNEETKIQKNEERLRNLWDNFKHSNIRIIWGARKRRGRAKNENLFDQTMKENSPIWQRKQSSRKFRKL